jgi:oligopeptide transport system substrate-binding protein
MKNIMPNFFKLIAIPVVFFFITVIISSCEQQKTQLQNQKKQTQQKHVGYLRLPLKSAIETIDPGKIFDITHVEVTEQLFLGLTDFEAKTYNVFPQLAKSWEVSKDGTVYTFHIRQDVKWINGEPVTAHDIVWAVQRNIAQETDSPYAHTLYILKNAEDIHYGGVAQLGVRAIDDYTVEFTLEKPASYFPALASLPSYRPLPRKTIESYGKDWILPKHIQTNGPYMLTQWDKGKKLILKKNPHYYKADKVNIPEVHFHIVQKNALALAMYEKNDLDIIGGQVYLQIPPRKIFHIESDIILRRERQIRPDFCTEWYGFNILRPPMNNPLVRKAIAAAIDKKTLLNVAVKGEAVPAKTFLRSLFFYAEPDDVDPDNIKPKKEIGILFNPKRAKAWLAKAGYPEGKGFPKVVLMHNSSKSHHKTAETIKTILKYHLNIEIELRAFDFMPYMNMLKQSNKPHIFRMSWCADYPDAYHGLYELFHPSQGINWVGWRSREFTKVLDQAQQTSHPIERKKLYHRADQILTAEEVAIVPLYFSNTQFMVKPWVKGWYPMAFGGQHICDWRLEN